MGNVRAALLRIAMTNPDGGYCPWPSVPSAERDHGNRQRSTRTTDSTVQSRHGQHSPIAPRTAQSNPRHEQHSPITPRTAQANHATDSTVQSRHGQHGSHGRQRRAWCYATVFFVSSVAL